MESGYLSIREIAPHYPFQIPGALPAFLRNCTMQSALDSRQK